MPKKLISTLACAASLVGSLAAGVPAFAEGTIDGVTYWEPADLVEYNLEIENEQTALCGDSSDCIRGYRLAHVADASNTKYQELSVFSTHPVVITSVNPSTGKIKFLYRGISGWERSQDYTAPLSPLNQLYFVWLDDGASDPRTDNSYFDIATEHFHPYYMDEVFANSFNDYTHLVYSLSIENGDAPVTDWDTEFEITVPTEHSLLNDPKHTIFYYSATSSSIQHSYHDYSSCLENPAYEEGMECRIIYREDYAGGFVPFTADGVPAVSLDTSPIEEDNGPDSTLEISNVDQENDGTLVPGIIDDLGGLTEDELIGLADPASEIVASRSAELASTEPISSIKTPDTGEEFILPSSVTENWSLICGLGAAFVVFVAWWFFPTRKKLLKK